MLSASIAYQSFRLSFRGLADSIGLSAEGLRTFRDHLRGVQVEVRASRTTRIQNRRALRIRAEDRSRGSSPTTTPAAWGQPRARLVDFGRPENAEKPGRYDVPLPLTKTTKNTPRNYKPTMQLNSLFRLPRRTPEALYNQPQFPQRTSKTGNIRRENVEKKLLFNQTRFIDNWILC